MNTNESFFSRFNRQSESMKKKKPFENDVKTISRVVEFYNDKETLTCSLTNVGSFLLKFIQYDIKDIRKVFDVGCFKTTSK